MPSAYLFVSHGSRDPRPQIAVEQLARLFAQSQAQIASQNNYRFTSLSAASSQLAAPTRRELMVGTACLELNPTPLHEQIKAFGDRAFASGYDKVQVIPLFLLPGIHVTEDIPVEVAIAQQKLGQKLKLNLQPYLGSHPGMLSLLATQQDFSRANAWIFLAHGSRRPDSQQLVATMAKQLGAVAAYWSVPPSLTVQVQELVKAGQQQIGIIPYFLFAGGITDAIAQVVEQLREEFAPVNLYLAEPLGASQQLAGLIWDLVEQ